MVIDTSPGGLTDILGRMAAEGLGREPAGRSGREQAGASGNIAIEFVLKSPADGYTLMICGGGNLVIKPSRSLVASSPRRPRPGVQRRRGASHPGRPSALPVKDLAEFIAYAKANPGKVYYGSAGIGSPPHLAAEQFARLAGLKLMHVPYKGVGRRFPIWSRAAPDFFSMSYGSARPH